MIMKTKLKNAAVAVIAIVGFGLASCSKDEVKPNLPEKEKPLPPHVEIPIAPAPDKDPHG